MRALQARGAWLPIWPIERARLPQWLRQRARNAQLTLGEDAAAMLAERCEGNLLAAQQEIDKLALLLPRGAAVSAADVAASSADSARFDVFQLGEAVRDADAARSLRILGGTAGRGRRAGAGALGAAARNARAACAELFARRARRKRAWRLAPAASIAWPRA